jgi:peroxiredoxin (alkyl hydroperoxide reductase subunit C)
MENQEVQQEVYSMPRIGDQAPDFTATTTKGQVTLSDFAKDKWIVFFSHPADFTPVCTTEMSGFAQRKKEFDDLNTELLGLSIDSIHAHLGWVSNVKEKTGVYFDFPIIADLDMSVSKKYGMLQPNEAETAAVREILRALKALQVSDQHKVALPLDWKPGDQVIVPPPKTLEEMDKRNKETGIDRIDFYLSKKDLKV